MNVPDSINAQYQQPDVKLWSGRKSDPDLGKQYWYQDIRFGDLSNTQSRIEADVALIGYACDEGVRRNQGRVGAKEGPVAIRKRLAKLPLHFDHTRVADVGDVVCIDEDMEACQELFSAHISNLIQAGVFPIALGGGHDMSYGHFQGVWDAIKNTYKKKIGIVNFDAHFDLRSVEEKGNSGTPFNQIISVQGAKDEPVDYFAVGIQLQSNTRELFTFAQDHNVQYALNEDCQFTDQKLGSLKERLEKFSAMNDYLYITLDLDGFTSAYAPGVSAPSPLGFSPGFIFEMLSFLLGTGKVVSFDIAELNPSKDSDGLTTDLAAKVVDFVVRTRPQI